MHEESWIPCVPAFLKRTLTFLVRFVFEEAISNCMVIKRLCQMQLAGPRSETSQTETSHLFSSPFSTEISQGLRVRATAPTTHRKRVQAKPVKHTTSHNVRPTPPQRGSLE